MITAKKGGDVILFYKISKERVKIAIVEIFVILFLPTASCSMHGGAAKA